MPVRLLLSVLMLTGPLPARLCTCAAASRAATIAVVVSQEVHQSEPASCKCRAKSHPRPVENECAVEVATDFQHRDSHPSGDAGCGTSPVRHDRDCPAVNPTPSVAPAVPTTAPELPTLLDFTDALRDQTFTGGLPRTASAHPTRLDVRSIPLYLALLTLRI